VETPCRYRVIPALCAPGATLHSTPVMHRLFVRHRDRVEYAVVEVDGGYGITVDGELLPIRWRRDSFDICLAVFRRLTRGVFVATAFARKPGRAARLARRLSPPTSE
jgi:hypothetical protein